MHTPVNWWKPNMYMYFCTDSQLQGVIWDLTFLAHSCIFNFYEILNILWNLAFLGRTCQDLQNLARHSARPCQKIVWNSYNTFQLKGLVRISDNFLSIIKYACRDRQKNVWLPPKMGQWNNPAITFSFIMPP